MNNVTPQMENAVMFQETAAIINLDQFLTLIFLFLVVFFMVHSAIVAYHWLTYGSSKAHAFTGVMVHIGIGLAILLAMGGIIIF